jgi:hypothetical protein
MLNNTTVLPSREVIRVGTFVMKYVEMTLHAQLKRPVLSDFGCT